MRRVLRVVRAVLLVGLTLLALATGAAWAYGAWTGNWHAVGGRWGGTTGDRFFLDAATEFGESCLLSGQDSEGPSVDSAWYWESWDSPTFLRLVGIVPFGCYVSIWDSGPRLPEGQRGFVSGDEGRGFRIRVPAWFPPVLFGAWPLLALVRYSVRRYRRRWRRIRGRCVRCGYNLIGLPDPRCPECGTALPADAPDVSAGGPGADARANGRS